MDRLQFKTYDKATYVCYILLDIYECCNTSFVINLAISLRDEKKQMLNKENTN